MFTVCHNINERYHSMQLLLVVRAVAVFTNYRPRCGFGGLYPGEASCVVAVTVVLGTLGRLELPLPPAPTLDVDESRRRHSPGAGGLLARRSRRRCNDINDDDDADLGSRCICIRSTPTPTYAALTSGHCVISQPADRPRPVDADRPRPNVYRQSVSAATMIHCTVMASSSHSTQPSHHLPPSDLPTPLHSLSRHGFTFGFQQHTST